MHTERGTERVTDVSPAEWRWVITISALLMALTFVPYAWAFASNAGNTRWQFMGILTNPQDGATYLAKIGEGARGQWLFTLAHTPENSDGSMLVEFYLLLGHVAALVGLPSVMAFHVARFTAGFVMYLALYHLGAAIWQRLNTRRLFFGLTAIGSGIGWLLVALMPSLHPIDVYVPEAIPFYATLANPHFPATIALLALLVSKFVDVFRPGFKHTPTVQNGGLAVALIALALALILPQAWFPFAASLCVYLVVQTVRTRRLPAEYQIRWVLLAIAPALPIVIYDLVLVSANPLYHIWNEQNQTLSGSPFNYVFGFGLLLIVTLPGIIRAVRRFEPDGDQLMLVWLITNALLLYAPINVQRRFVTGLIIPIGYFAARSLADYWISQVRFKRRELVLAAMFVLLVPGNVLVLLLPLAGIAQPLLGIQNFQMLSGDYSHALNWLTDHTTSGSVVLAPPGPSLWIPAYTPARVVYGHPFETINANLKLQQVNDWYAGRNCTELLNVYHVQYALTGPEDAGVNPAPLPYIETSCVNLLGTPVATFGSVTIYETHSYF
ncbi:MAG: hypothetical protein ACYDBJ_00870 [Aggregatilineales bacterium]